MALPRTVSVLEQGIAEGLHLGGQVFASIGGVPAADVAVGENAPGVPMTPNTMMLWQSGTKPIVAVAVGQLWERGLVALDDPVARFIPEYGRNGKEGVTLRHILTHTASLRHIIPKPHLEPWDDTLQRICSASLQPGWVPGAKAGYDPVANWFILGEVIRRVDGRPVDEYVRQEVFLPLGMTECRLAMPRELYRAYGDRMGQMYDTHIREGARILAEGSEAGCFVPRPGASGRGPARELGRFYEALRQGGEGLLSPETVYALTSRQRVGMYDSTFQCVVDWGLGFHVDSKTTQSRGFGYGFGKHASGRTFGHGGAQSGVSFCDPEASLVAAILVNGMPGEQAHNRRFRALTAALYEDLELA